MSGSKGGMAEATRSVAKKKDANGAQQSAMPLPKSQEVPRGANAGRDALKNAVHVAEAQVALLSNGKLERVLAPEAVVAEAGEEIAFAVEMAVSILDESPAEASEIEVLVHKLDAAIGALYLLGRKHHIPMRETHLEEIFDREDKLRSNFTSLGPLNRADNYYDTSLAPTAVTHEPAPNADAIEHELEKGDEPAQPKNREELIKQILGFAGDLRSALDVGYDRAVGTIKEPNQPKRPDLVERLVEVAMTVLTSMATAAIGNIIGSAFKAADTAIGVGEHLGGRLTETLIEGFKDTGKESAKIGMQALGSLDTKAPVSESKLSAKTLYLMAAKQRTADAMDATSHRFIGQEGTLRRVHVDTLHAIRGVFNKSTKETLSSTYADLLINEWVNFGKVASDEGEEMRDVDKRPAHPSKLDQFDDPYGVLRVTVALDSDANPRLLRAELPGVGDAVLAHLRREKQDLGTLAIHRRVEIAPHDSFSLPGGHFDLDPKGNVSAEPAKLSAPARLKWAQIAKHQLGDAVSDGDVYLGMYALTRWLETQHCSQIYGGDE